MIGLACGGFQGDDCLVRDTDGACVDDDGADDNRVPPGCPEGPIGPDETVPGGCDPCAGLEGGDRDGDGVCDAHDPCPDDPADRCEEPIFFLAQVDGFAEGARVELTDPQGEVLLSRGFRGAGDRFVERVDVPVRGISCLGLSVPTGRRGGIRGMILARRRNVVFHTWDSYDWRTASTSYCFQPLVDGEWDPELPLADDFFEEQRLCEVSLRFFPGQHPEEHAWRLLREDTSFLAGFERGTLGSVRQYSSADVARWDDRLYALRPGEYRVDLMYSQLPSREGPFAADSELRVSVEGAEVLFDRLQSSDCGTQRSCNRVTSFTVTCR